MCYVYNFLYLNVTVVDVYLFYVHFVFLRVLTGLTTPVGSVRNRCVKVVMLLFGFFSECRGFCHRAGSDLFLLHLGMYVFYLFVCWLYESYIAELIIGSVIVLRRISDKGYITAPHLVAFYDTLGTRRTYSRPKQPASPQGAELICILPLPEEPQKGWNTCSNHIIECVK